MRAVQPLFSLLAFTWALWASKVCTVVISPLSAAYIKAVQPCQSRAFTSAPLVSRACTVVGSPFSAAYIKAVRPLASRACTSTPLASRARVVGVSPLLTALIKGGGSLLERLTILQPPRRSEKHRSMPTSRKGHVLSCDKRNARVVIRVLP